MAEFSVRVMRIAEPVEHHPNADRLSIVRIQGFLCISGKVEGLHRYAQGDHVAYIPEGAVLPDWLLQQMDFWQGSPDSGSGTLAGPLGNRVKAMKLRGVVSQGVLYPVVHHPADLDLHGDLHVVDQDGLYHVVAEGDDVAALLGISKYEPPIPTHMAGEVCYIGDATLRYDVENGQAMPDLFTPMESVQVTEKLHGTNCCIGYVPGLLHPELFADGNLYVASKGLGTKGLVFKNLPSNAGNLYVKALQGLLATGFYDRIRALSEAQGGQPVHVVAEIFGKGVQDLTYGCEQPTLRLIEVAIGHRFVPVAGDIERQPALSALADRLGLPTVPVLYTGPYETDRMISLRDGKTILGGGHIREGVVIRACTETPHPLHGRRIAKLVSPDYLLRKSAHATEFA